MLRYYFHVRRGHVIILDREGVELANLEEATREAVRRAVQIEASEALKGVRPSGGMIIVSDQFGTVLEVPLAGNTDEAAQSAKSDDLS